MIQTPHSMGESLVMEGPKWGPSSTGHSIVTPTCLGMSWVGSTNALFIDTTSHHLLYHSLIPFPDLTSSREDLALCNPPSICGDGLKD